MYAIRSYYARLNRASAAGRPTSRERPAPGGRSRGWPLDPVRYITNRSSGKMGYAVALAAAEAGAEVVLVSGPVSLA